jgi:undecaprenyl-diphosphatase
MATVRGAFVGAARWVADRDIAVLLAVLVVVLGVLGFIRLADAVKGQHTQGFDERILLALRNPADPSQLAGPWPAREFEIARDITALGGRTVLTLVTLSVAGFLLISRRRHAMWLLLLAVVGGTLASALLKDVFDRPRPTVVPHLMVEHSPSFPSGHSMLSAVVYLTLGSLLDRFLPQRRLKLYVLTLALLLTCLIGLSRLALGVHYPTDVLGGWTAGLVWAVVCWMLARHLQIRGAVEKDTAARCAEDP